MKSRGMTYLLLAVVLGVWGVVLWKVFFTRRDAAIVSPVATVHPVNRNAAIIDTLRLDYRDPFLEIPPQTVPPLSERATVRSILKQADRSEPEAPTFSYLGVIRKSDKLHFLFTVEGSQVMIRPGESIGEYRLCGGCADSVQFIKGLHSFYLKPPV